LWGSGLRQNVIANVFEEPVAIFRAHIKMERAGYSESVGFYLYGVITQKVTKKKTLLVCL
jgi:hypothetical protein